MNKNKSDFDREIAAETGDAIADIAVVTELFIKKLAESIADGDQVVLINFGKFRLREQGGATLNAEPSTRRKFRVHFVKARSYSKAIQARYEEPTMDKFAVDESVDQEALIKAASDGCPECGAKCERHGSTLLCPKHGSAPFEKKQE